MRVKIKTHFIVPLEGEQNEGEDKNFIHSKTIAVLNLLSQLAPGYKKYGSQGYGHNIVPMDYDPTIKNIEFSIMAPSWVVEVNMVFRILTGHRYRPSTWKEYIDNEIAARKAVVADLNILIKKLSIYFRKHKPISIDNRLFDNTSTYFQRLRKLPIEALDPWGYSEERSPSDVNRQSNLTVKYYSAGLLRFEEFNEHAGNYRTGISNFINQSPNYLAVYSHLGKAKSGKKKRELNALAASLNINLVQSHLPGSNLFDSWKALEKYQEHFMLNFSKASGLSNNDLLELQDKEKIVFGSAWCLWFAFINHPERCWNTAEKTSRLLFSNAKKTILEKLKSTFSNRLASGVKVNIISQGLYYDGQAALWLTVESDDFLETYLCLEEIHQQLQQITKGIQLHSLEYHVWEKYWKNVLVIPLAKGKLLQAHVWCLPTYSFMEIFNSDELSWVNQVIRPLSIKTTTDLNLTIWDKPLLNTRNDFSDAVTMIHQYILHLLEIDKIPDNKGSGIEVIQSYMDKIQEHISSLSQRFLDISALIMELPCKLTEDELLDRDVLLEVAQALSESYRDMLPQDDCNGSLQLDLKDIEEWSQRVSNVSEKMQLISLYWASDIIENT